MLTFSCHVLPLFRADPEKGAVNKNIDFGLQANIAIELVKAMFSEAPCKWIRAVVI
jgi:hypothetical protein